MIQVIPAIDLIGGKCVRLSQGDFSRKTTYEAGPAEMVSLFLGRGLRSIHIVDLDGAGRPPRQPGRPQAGLNARDC